MSVSVITAIGLMSGGSMESVDVALVATDGEARIVRRQSLTFPLAARQERLGAEDLTEFCAEAVRHFLESFAIARNSVALIGFHAAEAPRSAALSRAIERGEDLARATGIDVVYDFGAADRQAGGRGRPLEPVYHRALAELAGLPRPLAMVEIGDEVTVIFIGEDGSLTVLGAGSKVTGDAVATVRKSLPAMPLLWLLAGDKEQSAPLLETLRGLFPEPVHRAEDMGWPVGHFEAEAFAYLAVRSLRRLPLTYPGTTGVKQPITGGRLARAPRR
jgi:1,6-anhydro-N-acetylmuramate kinase